MDYEYFLKDQLGNIRVVFNKKPLPEPNNIPKLLSTDDYYPFGLTFNSKIGSPRNDYRFQGQEHQDDFLINWSSFKWRNHQPDIGRFFNIDPLAHKYVHNSPYAFSENKLINMIELEGLEAVPKNIVVKFNAGVVDLSPEQDDILNQMAALIVTRGGKINPTITVKSSSAAAEEIQNAIASYSDGYDFRRSDIDTDKLIDKMGEGFDKAMEEIFERADNVIDIFEGAGDDIENPHEDGMMDMATDLDNFKSDGMDAKPTLPEDASEAVGDADQVIINIIFDYDFVEGDKEGRKMMKQFLKLLQEFNEAALLDE
jgi:RHS repeat-associated protein